MPDLQWHAVKILAQPASASIVERVNSEFVFIHDKKRNTLGHTKAEMPVYIFHNLRILKKMKAPTHPSMKSSA